MLLSALVAAFFLPIAYPFTFTLSSENPGQCGIVNVAWQGGSPPFSMTIMPAFDYPANISIPDSAWDSDSNSGSYDWTVNYPSGTQYVALMSDSSGTGTGGVSTLSTVKSSSNSSSCTLRSVQTDFLFYLNETSVTQCHPVEIYWDSTAVSPVTILGVIPGGQIFQLWSSGGGTSLVWNTNIAASTRFILAAFDEGKYGNGGSSSLLSVGASSNSACIDDASPSSTPVNSATGSPTSTASHTGSEASGATTTGAGGVKTVTAIATALPAGAAGLSTGAIAGIALAAVVVVVVAQALFFWFCCRRQLKALLSHRREMREHGVKAGDVDLLEAPNPRYDSANVDSSDSASFADLTPDGDGDTASRLRDPRRTSSYGFSSPVSPFWDATMTQPSSTSDLRFSSYSDVDPPQLPQLSHIRTDSLGSIPSISPSNNGDYDASPSPASGPHHPSQFLLPLVPHPQASRTPARASGAAAPGPGPSGSRGTSTKAQLVAALSTRNPDSPAPQSPHDRAAGPRVPPQEAPAGGFRYHDDAGRIEVPAGPEREAEVEDLPPMYRPEWEDERRRESGDGGGR